MRIQVRYFAQLRDERGLPLEQVELEAGTPMSLYHELRSRHGFSLSPENLMVAVNEEFVSWSHVLRDGDQVVFLPPVAGG